MGRPNVRRVLRGSLALVLVDIALVVMTGGVSLLGPTGAAGLGWRIAIAVALVAIDYRVNDKSYVHAYLVLLLLCVPLLHFRGYRVRGDGLWYYSFAHSLAIDGDIDLGNQYRKLGVENATGSRPVRETGRPRFTFPVGAPLVWVPLVWLGHASTWLANAYGADQAYDGWSDPYLHTVAFGNFLLGWLGLLVLDRFLRRWFTPVVAFYTTASIGLGTFLAWYLTYHAIYTHALTFLLIVLVLDRWASAPKTVRQYAIAGLVLGAAACVRWQNAVFGLLFVPTLVPYVMRKQWRFVLSVGGAFGAAALLGVLPQILSWRTIFARLYIGVPLGEDYMRWSDPFLTETLFASRHGLFSWSPLTLVAVIGFPGFLKRYPRTGIPLAIVLLLLTYVNASVADWWAGGSFGARRFDSLLPIFALGLATAIGFVIELVRRHPKAVTGLALLVFVVANGLLMEQYRKGRLPVDDTISWQSAAEGALEDIFDGVGYPFSFPMNWIFAAHYDRPKTQYDILVGKYLFHRMHNLGGVIDIGPSDPPFIGNGWSGVRDWRDAPRSVRYALGPRSGVFVPTDRAEPLRIAITCAVPDDGIAVPVEVWLNGARLGGFFADGEMSDHVLTADGEWWQRINLLELVPAEDTEGRAFLAVDRLTFERLAAAP